ncbi:putative periplasmic solute-binding protein [Gottschalkia purinilytica]|uniref:Putative periplasmic solute-binding protein n=1 Tax=Gottschalkia purinilytica TaxID=1503 RepID=A0A0L0WF95_GOTPU|nr:endolytic transglycosylase MltG [Gottschalkia purinilytica]KNF10157.1 putative periplasmic solute-binding protein [Gottschalkia purinilytica]
MDKFIEKVKDFLYDATDYVLILLIVVVVAGVIGWKLDILFAKGSDDENIASNTSKVEKEISKESKSKNKNKDKNKNSDKKASNKNDKQDNKKTDKEVKKEVIPVTIPQGSLPPAIANILVEQGVISDKYEFLKKSQEMQLDTKLRSGYYEIEKGSSLETIIKVIAKQQ